MNALAPAATPDAARAAVVVEALTWDGTPYHPKARVRGAGVDCAQLLVAVFAACGLIPAGFDPGDYPGDWHLHRDDERFLGFLRELGAEIDPADARTGDVLAWRYGRAYSHAAILLTDDPAGPILHALRPVGVVRARADDEAFAGRPARAFTLFGAG